MAGAGVASALLLKPDPHGRFGPCISPSQANVVPTQAGSPMSDTTQGRGGARADAGAEGGGRQLGVLLVCLAGSRLPANPPQPGRRAQVAGRCAAGYRGRAGPRGHADAGANGGAGRVWVPRASTLYR